MIKHKAKAIKVRREPFDERTISMIASEIGKRHCSKFFKESEESQQNFLRDMSQNLL